MTIPAGSFTSGNLRTELSIVGSFPASHSSVLTLSGDGAMPVSSAELRGKSNLVVDRQMTASVVDLAGYNNIAYPATNAKAADGQIAYSAGSPPYRHFYYDFGAPKMIGSFEIKGQHLIAYGDNSGSHAFYAGVWGSNDALSWTLIETFLNSEGAIGNSGEIAVSPQTWRYIGYGNYSYYIYDGYAVLDQLRVKAAP